MAQRNRAFSRSGLQLTHPNAAGIDIGSASHFVAVPPDRDDEPVRELKSFTADLVRLADWLAACGVDTVAMESTGVYWIALYELLDARGFEVLLVNARHVKNVTGRKSDVASLSVVAAAHELRAAARGVPPGRWGVRAACLRASARGIGSRTQSRCVQHMQKALAQMNIQLANTIADVAGQRDPYALAALKSSRIRASDEEVARSLQGNWRAEHLFALAQALEAFDFCGPRSSRSATPRSRRSSSGCARPRPTRPRASAAAARATRRGSTCVRGCSRCAAWTSRASTAST